MAKVLVTGAAGFIGSHTVDLLLDCGHEVIGVDNLRTGRLENLQAALRHARFVFRQEDLTAPGVLSELTAGFRPDAIIHLAALVSVPESIAKPALNRLLNFDLTRLVCEAALATGSVRRIVFASSAAVYGASPHLPLSESAPCEPLSPYGQAKLDSEALLLAYARERPQITVRCQRYFNVYGPRQDSSSSYSGVISLFIDAIARNHPPTIFGDGEQTRDFIAVHDVARANVLAATAPKIATGVANICTGDAVSVNTLFTVLARLMKCSLQPIYGPARKGDIRHSRGSPTLAASDLAFRSSHTLEATFGTMV
jgi:UDP-glucose 4-epimerase